MGDKKQCPICEYPMRTDLIVRHMLRHRKEIGCFMSQSSIKWSIDNKSTIMYKLNTSQPFKSYGVCLICKQGRTQHTSLGDFQTWSKLHDRRNVCTKRWDDVSHYFTSAYETPEVKEQDKEDVRSTETPPPVQPEPEPKPRPEALPPPTSPKLTIQNTLPERETRNEIYYESSESVDSMPTTQTLEIWDRDNPTVQRVYDALSDILEQGMTYKLARCEYSELLEELESDKALIGDAWKALYDFIDDELTLAELDLFLTQQ